MNFLIGTILGLTFFAVTPAVYACDEHKMMSACKSECPNAKTGHDTHKCMKLVAKKKNSDEVFKKSDCFIAFTAHEESEKKEWHKH